MNKCLCPCPDYIQWEDGAGTHTQLLTGFGTVLHGRKATTECENEKCKQGLCEDCVAYVRDGIEYGGWIPVTLLCPTCAEVTR